MILALQTGGTLASLAVLEGTEVVAEHAFRHRMSLSRELVPALDALLGQAQASWEEVEAVAVGRGPGSFTGLRLGMVTAKALAWAADRPVLGISSLAALVAPYPATPETLLCAVIEARADEFFTALYQRRAGTLQIRAEPTVLATAELSDRLNSYPGPVLLAGHAARFTRQAPPIARLVSLPFDEEPQARWVGRLAVERLRAGERDHPATLAPLYVRPPAPIAKLQAASAGGQRPAPAGEGGPAAQSTAETPCPE